MFLIAVVPLNFGGAGRQQAAVPGDPEGLLWAEVQALRASEPATPPAGAGFEAARARRAALLQKVQRYGALYPGGAHRNDALRLELLTLFELGSLAGGDFDVLRERIVECMLHPPCPTAPHEAAYWSTVIFDPDEPTPASAPAAASTPSRPMSNPSERQVVDGRLAAAWERYVQHYPESRYAPRLALELFDRAERADDRPAMERLVAAAEANFPHEANTRLLAARLRRARAVGSPFWLDFDSREQTFDTRRRSGVPVLIVVWSSDDGRSDALCREVEDLRRRHAELAVFGVCLDYDHAAMEAFVRRTSVPWPQFFDGRGPANEFALAWGVVRTPLVFVVDRRGRLLGAAAESWKTLAEQALEN